MNSFKVLSAFSTLLISTSLSGCMSTNDAFAPVKETTEASIGYTPRIVSSDADIAESNQLTDDLIQKTLTIDSAVKIALLNNKSLQASYNEIGIAQASVIRGSLPANPVIAFDQTRGTENLETERLLMLNIFSVVTIPARREIAIDQLRAAQMRAAEATIKVALDTRQQYLRTVASRERISKLNDIKKLTDAGADIAKRMGETGGLNKLSQARELSMAAELDNEIAKAKLDEQVERERLIRALGLWGERTSIKIPEKLPPLPTKLKKLDDIESEAIKKRVDLQAARHDLDAMATSLGLTQVTRFVTDIDLVGGRISDKNTDTGETEKFNKIGVDIEIPIFDFGTARSLDAEQRYMKAANLLADKAIKIRSEVREAYLAYRGMHEITRHFDTQIMPLRRTIEEESLLQYSGMLSDVSELIAETKAGIAVQIRAINSKRDFFIAENQLKAAMVGGGAGGGIDFGTQANSQTAEPAGH